ncbi:MAG TPA: amphi-Trp domain-containing protein [Pilimelia sp.]|nr:amphi-Trp domain-containing protein [Pilimelia sp.]
MDERCRVYGTGERGRSMAEVEITRKIRLTRAQAGERLIELGRALTAAPTSELDVDGDSIKFAVADEVDWEFELEVDGDEVELEIELKWIGAPVGAPAPAPAPAAAATTTAKRSTNSRRSSGEG